MRYRLAAHEALDAQLRLLREEHLVAIEVATLGSLLIESDVDPMEVGAGTP